MVYLYIYLLFNYRGEGTKMSSVSGTTASSLALLDQLARQIGFSHQAVVHRDALILYPEVREMCSADRCKSYGKSWSCPPACGSLSAMEKKLNHYSCGLLVQTTGRMNDHFDLQVIHSVEERHRKMFDTFVRQARMLIPGCLPLGSGGCRRCHKCTYPDRPCRHPEKLYPSMEAVGLWVSDVCKHSGLEYYYGPDTLTYTAVILLKDEDSL